VLNGEYGRSNIVGAGILRQSAAPPVVNPNDPLTIAALSDYVAQTTRTGWLLCRVRVQFFEDLPNRELFDEGAYVMPVCSSPGLGKSWINCVTPTVSSATPASRTRLHQTILGFGRSLGRTCT